MLTYGYVNVNNSYSISKIDIFIFYWLTYYNNLYMFFIIFIQNNSLNKYRIIFLAILVLLTFMFSPIKNHAVYKPSSYFWVISSWKLFLDKITGQKPLAILSSNKAILFLLV